MDPRAEVDAIQAPQEGQLAFVLYGSPVGAGGVSGHREPRYASEWTALLQVASGEKSISVASFARLIALGLVQNLGGKPVLTQRGNAVVGLRA
jgi:hypothetical protein